MREKLAALLLLLLAAACGAALAGCGGESEAGREDSHVEAALADLNTFTQGIIERVEAAPDPSAGVDDAQQYLDSRKADLEARLRGLAAGGDGPRLGEEMRRRVLEQRTEAEMKVLKLRHTYFDDSMRDPAFKAKLNKLIADYQELLKSAGDS